MNEVPSDSIQLQPVPETESYNNSNIIDESSKENVPSARNAPKILWQNPIDSFYKKAAAVEDPQSVAGVSPNSADKMENILDYRSIAYFSSSSNSSTEGINESTILRLQDIARQANDSMQDSSDLTPQEKLVAAICCNMKKTLDANEFQCIVQHGIATLLKYSTLTCLYDTLEVRAMVPKAFRSAIVKSSLTDSSIKCRVNLSLIYCPANTIEEDSFNCRTSKVAIEPYLKSPYIYTDMLPMIPANNAYDEKSFLESANNPFISRNFCERTLCLIALQRLIGINNQIVYAGGTVAIQALSPLLSTSMEVPLKMDTKLALTYMSVENFRNVKVLSGYHPSAGLMSHGNVLRTGELRMTMRMLGVYNEESIKKGNNRLPTTLEGILRFLYNHDDVQAIKAETDSITTGILGFNKDWINEILGPQFKKDIMDNKQKLLLMDLSHIKDLCVFLKRNGWSINNQGLFQLCFKDYRGRTKPEVDLLKSLFTHLAHKQISKSDRLSSKVMLELFPLPSFRYLSNKLSDDNNTAMLEANLLWIRDVFGPRGIVTLLENFDKPKVLFYDLTLIHEMCVVMTKNGSSDTDQVFQVCFGNICPATLSHLNEMCVYFIANGWSDMPTLSQLCFVNATPTKADVDLLKTLFSHLVHREILESERLSSQVIVELFTLPSFRYLSNKLAVDNNAAVLESNLLWIRDIFGPNGVVSLLKHFDKPKILIKDNTHLREMCRCLIEDGLSDTKQLFELCCTESEIEALINTAIRAQGDDATVSSIATAIELGYHQVYDWLNYHRPEYLEKLQENKGLKEIEALINTAIQDQGDEATVSSIATAIDRDRIQVYGWLTYHRPEYLAKLREMRGNRKWTSEEDKKIRDAYRVHGNNYEAIISQCFPDSGITSAKLQRHIGDLKKKALANGYTEWWQHTTETDDVAEISKSSNEEVVQICTCKKSQCLKLYCKCFASGGLCGTMCQCVSCKNNTECDEQLRKAAIKDILSRNPKAFDKYSAQEERDDSIPVKMHTYSCKCRKSACLKKYCECYNASQKCNPTCGCLDCKNMPDSDSMTAKEGSFVVPPNEGLPFKKRPFNQISNASDSDQADSEGVMLVDENSEEE